MAVGLYLVIALVTTTVSLNLDCIDFTTSDVLGPFFVEDVPKKLKIAPDEDMRDPSKGTIIKGKTGDYEFIGSFPGTYDGRPIPHIHVKIETPGRNGKTFITQIYFKGMVPPSYVDYVRTRGSQFGKISTKDKCSGLPNGGRVVEFNVRLRR